MKVIDDFHLSGKYRGTADKVWNVDVKRPHNIPVFCHNINGYDTHLYLKELPKKYGKIDLIANIDENYINYTVNSDYGFEFDTDGKARTFIKVSFVDTFRFMASSIEKLAKRLNIEDWKRINTFIRENTILGNIVKRQGRDEEDMFKILSGKGIFPYKFIDSVKKLNYDKEIKRGDFYSSLNGDDISEDDFKYYLKVWSLLKYKTLGNYSDIYNIQDVILLADIFEDFRDVCLRNYVLDPAHYLTASSLAWDAMQKLTKINVEFIDGHSMYLTIESGIREGISQTIKRYSKANNAYVKAYEPTIR